MEAVWKMRHIKDEYFSTANGLKTGLCLFSSCVDCSLNFTFYSLQMVSFLFLGLNGRSGGGRISGDKQKGMQSCASVRWQAHKHSQIHKCSHISILYLRINIFIRAFTYKHTHKHAHTNEQVNNHTHEQERKHTKTHTPKNTPPPKKKR